MIATGAVLKVPTDIFRDEVTSRLQRVVENSPGTCIIVVPSVRDMVSRHVAYPQAMLDKEQLGLPKVRKVDPSFSVPHVVPQAADPDHH
jgi:DNA polymerase alpha subunit B